MAELLRASATKESMAHLARPVLPCKCSPRVLRVRAHASDASVTFEYHSTLGVSFGASKLEIKSAYRRLARKLHPDVCKDGCSEQWFKRINHAYESLTNRSCSASMGVSTTLYSEAGNQSLEDLLNNEMGDYETWWSAEEKGSSDECIDCSWLKAGEPQESADASIFTTPPEVEEETNAEIAWFTAEFEAGNCSVCYDQPLH